MCGIAGIYAPKTDPALLTLAIERMVEAQNHRGPDARGIYVDAENGCALGHNRLSIIDLSSAGHQPMANVGERQIISYNGEVYNFQELRSQLSDKRDFSSHSDTEVILAAYERWGLDAFARLNGMFAFALLDHAVGRLIIVRDRLGIKPLFYAELAGGGLVFSSEIKGILASGIVASNSNLGRLGEFLYFGSTLGDHTLYEGVRQLTPGSWLSIDLRSGKISKPTPYWSVCNLDSKPFHGQEKDAVDTTRNLLEASVKRQLASDVPVGAFLSGGVDSSAIVALAHRHYGSNLRTYTVGFDYIGDGEELPQARKVAQQFGTEHHELHVSGNNIQEVIEKLAYAHDQPFADPANLPLFQLCEALGGETKVILQGDGGDELFGGYRRYTYLRLSALARLAGAATDQGLDFLRGRYGKRVFGAHRFFHALSLRDPAERMALLLSVEGPLNPPSAILNRELRELVDRQDPFERYRSVTEALPPTDDLQQMLHTDLQILLPDIFLEKVDRSTMAASIEVRVPFLDFDLVDYVAGLPSSFKVGIGQRKKLLRSALQGIVPDEILNAPKRGFGVPIANWLAGPLRDYAQSRILSQAGPDGWFDAAAVQRLFDEHASGRRDHAQLLWKSLQLALWRENLPLGTAPTI